MLVWCLSYRHYYGAIGVQLLLRPFILRCSARWMGIVPAQGKDSLC